jgi:hypothetical protein
MGERYAITHRFRARPVTVAGPGAGPGAVAGAGTGAWAGVAPAGFPLADFIALDISTPFSENSYPRIDRAVLSGRVHDLRGAVAQ